MDEQRVGVSVPISDVPERERGSCDGMALRDQNVTDLPGVCTVVIQIELVQTTLIVLSFRLSVLLFELGAVVGA